MNGRMPAIPLAAPYSMVSITREVTPVGTSARTNSGTNNRMRWVCPSIRPGTNVSADASITCAPWSTSSAAGATRAMRPSLIQSARSRANSPLTESKSEPATITVSGGSSPSATRMRASRFTVSALLRPRPSETSSIQSLPTLVQIFADDTWWHRRRYLRFEGGQRVTVPFCAP